MVHIPKQKRQKLDSKSIECVMVGYCDITKGYKLFNKATRDIIVSRDVIFLKNQNTDTHNMKEPKNFNQSLIDLGSVRIPKN